MSNEDDLPEVTPRDAVEIAQRALAKANRVDELEEELDVLEDRLAAQELRYSEVEEARDYDPNDTDGNVGRVREHAFRKATRGRGGAMLDYDDVMWEVFDGQPSADYCYKLMRLAGEARGFEYKKHATPKHLVVDAAEAKRGAAFSSANKTSSEGGAS